MKKYRYSTHPIAWYPEPTQECLDIMHLHLKKGEFNYFLRANWKFPKDTKRPLLAGLNKETKKLEFPLSGSGIITGNEYMTALQERATFNIKEIWQFANADVFSGQVDHYYKLKAEATTRTSKDYAKLMLNSLYGKFAQHLGYAVWYSYEATKEGLNAKKKVFEAGIKNYEDLTNKYRLYPDFYATNTQGELIFPCQLAIEITANSSAHSIYSLSSIGDLEKYKIPELIKLLTALINRTKV